VDKTNSQPRSLPASVGSDQPIEVPDTQNSSLQFEEPQPPNEATHRAQQRTAAARQDSQVPDDAPRSRHRRYYDDSDDMIERVRRARAAFEKKTRAFQGPDWPYYEKRVIVGQKKKEDMDPSLFQDNSATSSSPDEPDKAKE
jgi:hypothetical protein